MKQINPIIVIAGATATGKTNIAITAAEKLGGEVISADSMQIYKYMNIGTAKPSSDEMRGIKHYLIDELYPDEPYNVAVFRKMSEEAMNKAIERGKVPIIAGGTGFYINALVKGTEFSENASNPEIRKHYEELAEKYGHKHIYDILCEKDSLSSAAIHQNNVKRVIRALEYFDATGESISLHNESEKSKSVNNDVVLFVLDIDRKALYEKIDRRVDKMIEDGLLNEVMLLLELGYDEGLTSMQGIGYKEIVRHIRGEYSFENAIIKIKQATRNYAKRQITWFKHQTDGIILNAELAADEIYSAIEKEIKRRSMEAE